MGFFNALPGAVAEGLIWGLMAICSYISYKILDIADLTVRLEKIWVNSKAILERLAEI